MLFVSVFFVGAFFRHIKALLNYMWLLIYFKVLGKSLGTLRCWKTNFLFWLCSRKVRVSCRCIVSIYLVNVTQFRPPFPTNKWKCFRVFTIIFRWIVWQGLCIAAMHPMYYSAKVCRFFLKCSSLLCLFFSIAFRTLTDSKLSGFFFQIWFFSKEISRKLNS